MKQIGTPAHWPSFLRVAFAVAVMLLTLERPLYANEWVGLANISMTMGVSDSRICVGEGLRGDIGCPTYAPFVEATTGYLGIGTAAPSVTLTVSGTTFSNALSLKSVTGAASPVSNTVSSGGGGGASALNDLTDVTLSGSTTGDLLYYNGSAWINQASSGLFSADRLTSGTHVITVNTASGYVSLSTSGTDWGYLGSASSYLPTLTANLVSSTQVSATNISATALTVNGVAITGTGASALASLTDVSATAPTANSLLRYNGSTWEAVGINEAVSTTSMVAGWPDALACNFSNPNQGLKIIPLVYAPYVGDGKYYYRHVDGSGSASSFMGFSYNSDGSYDTTQYVTSGGVQTTASDCDGKTIATLYAEGKAFNFIGNNGTSVSSSTAAGDALISGTLAVTANSDTSIVSLTTAGTTWGYLGATGSYLPRLNTPLISATTVSTSVISTTAVQVISQTTPLTCDSTTAGTLRYNSSNTALELCTGSDWQVMGVGIPAGTISAFASTTCPTGWSEYTAARGRFLRGIDNGAGNDPSGTRSPGGTQADALQTHSHKLNFYNGGYPLVYGSDNAGLGQMSFNVYELGGADPTNYWANDISGAQTSTETRPKNVAVTYCQFNGTSNGWNNPLSGGSTTPGGSTGQLQYNTSGSFDASAGLTWDNAASKLTATNISATALTVNGVAITGSSEGDRITSGTTSLIAATDGTITASASISVSGKVSATTVQVAESAAETCSAATAGTIKLINGRPHICRHTP